LRDPEKRFRRRHLDFLVNRESIETLKKRRDVSRMKEREREREREREGGVPYLLW